MALQDNIKYLTEQMSTLMENFKNKHLLLPFSPRLLFQSEAIIVIALDTYRGTADSQDVSQGAIQLQSTWTCSKRLSAPGNWTGNDHFKAHRSFRSCLEAQEFITAVSSEHVPISERKLDASNVKLMVDSGSSVSVVDKAYLPLASRRV